jgi:hypothetical protein
VTTIRIVRRPAAEKTQPEPPDSHWRSASARGRTATERPQTLAEADWDSEGGARRQ